MVTDFHRKFGHPVAYVPHIPSDERVRVRLRLIAEEFCELLESALGRPKLGTDAWQLWNNLHAFSEYINNAPVMVDLPSFSDALAGLAYVVEGTNIEFGIDGLAVLRLVHDANMLKQPAESKPTTPAGWCAPDIEGELKRQGWAE
jgi:predicted HAD superfamily Cof-like phosphohydrolase